MILKDQKFNKRCTAEVQGQPWATQGWLWASRKFHGWQQISQGRLKEQK